MTDKPKNDVFESDPFFNPTPKLDPKPAADPEPPASDDISFDVAALEAAPDPVVPHATAEERLLNTIVGGEPPEPTPDSNPAASQEELDALRNELETARATGQKAETSRARAQQDLQIFKTRFSALESDLATARKEAAAANQLRIQAEARHAESEKQWTGKLDQLRGMLEEVEDIRDELASKRVPKIMFIGSLVVGVFATAGAYFLGASLSVPGRPGGEPTPPAAPVIALPSARLIQEPALNRPLPWPVIEGSRWTTTQAGQEMKIVFSYGTFARNVELLPEAKQDLKAIATSLNARGDRFRIEVEGHTDAAKGGSSKASGSNSQALGLARARAVAAYLVKQAGVPASLVATSSAGEGNPPYPNTTLENQKKNRTVVLKITKTTASSARLP